MIMWLCFSMHLGALSLQLLGQTFFYSHPCILLSPIMQLKNQWSGEGVNIDVKKIMSYNSYAFMLCEYLLKLQNDIHKTFSILSKYGVHGFPTLVLLNSTMHVRYHGSRTLGSLVAFYSDVTGIKSTSVEGRSLDKIGLSSDHKEPNNEQESYPFFWARSPENLLRQETYLALAILFVILRLFYFIFPALSSCVLFVWRRYIANMRPKTLWECPMTYLNQVIQLFNSINEPCKRSNL